jgi:thiosulfate sulfurtransferase
MGRVFVFVVVTILGLGVRASAGPQIAVDAPAYNFPDTTQGMAVVHTFVLSNVGDQELVITSAGPSCKCTSITIVLTADRLQPGESVDLYAVLDTYGLSGRILKKAIVASNDPGSDGDNEITLSFAGTIVEAQPYQKSPGKLFYESYILLDARDPAAYDAGHLIGAMNVPPSQAVSLTSGLPPSAMAVIYDQDGASSGLSAVAESLHRAGLGNVYSLQGGLDRWQKTYGSVRMTSGIDPSWGAFLDVSGTTNYPSTATVRKYFPAQLLTDYILVDIRPPAEFAASHLAGAVNLSEAELGTFVDSLRPETPVVVYSADGIDSERVVHNLWLHGSRVMSLLGGLAEWQKLYGNSLLVASDR